MVGGLARQIMDTPRLKPNWPPVVRRFASIARSICFLIGRQLAPKSRREDDARREYILNILLAGSLALSALFFLSVCLNRLAEGSSYKGITPLSAGLLVSVFIGLYVLSRLGHYHPAAYLLVAVYFFPSAYSLYHWGLLLEIPLLGLALVVVMLSILAGTRAAFAVSGFIVFYLGCLYYGNRRGFVAFDQRWLADPVQWTYVIELGVMLGLFAIVTWLSNREIEKSLRRARRSEATIKKDRDLLESRVEERTKKLKEVQLKNFEQVYRFAEFGRLASGFFHDIVNPLTAVSLHLEQLTSGRLTTLDETKNRLNQAFSATKKLEQFMGMIKKQIQNEDTRTYFSLRDEIQQAIDVLGYKARTLSAEIRLQPEKPVFMWGNAIKFHQVVVNLTANAIDAYEGVPEPGERFIDITLAETPGGVELTVSDRGQGIPADILPRIFDPLVTTKKPGHGLGIGLATVSRIVTQELGGTITVASRPGIGTKFIVHLPLNPSR